MTKSVKGKTASKAGKKKAATKKPTAKSTTAGAHAARAQTINMMEKTMTQGKNQFDKMTQDAAKNGKENVDAFIRSGTVWMKGMEDFAKTYMGWAQSSAEKNSQAAKAILSCKTINEFAETQNKWAQQNFDDFMAGATKLSELGVKITTEAFEPINDQLGKSLKKATEKVAA